MSQVKLAPHEKGQVLFTHAFDTPGSHVVEVFADADPLKADNSFLASIPVRDKVPVLLVNGDPSVEPMKGETDFAEIALAAVQRGACRTGRSAFDESRCAPRNWIAKRLSESAVVIMANVRKLTDDQLRGLEDFVKNGGGLLIFAGNRVDSGWYNTALFKDGKGPAPAEPRSDRR